MEVYIDLGLGSYW